MRERRATRRHVAFDELVSRSGAKQDRQVAATRRDILHRVAQPRLLPVNQPNQSAALPEQVAWPVVTVHQCARLIPITHLSPRGLRGGPNPLLQGVAVRLPVSAERALDIYPLVRQELEPIRRQSVQRRER